MQVAEPAPSQGGTTAIAIEGKSSAIDGSGDMHVPASPQEVWDLLLDPDQMARLIPGCERLEQSGDGRFNGTVMLGVGPVKGRFEVAIELTDLDEPRRATLTGTADGPLGSSRGQGSFVIEPDETGSTVRYDYTVELSGKIAAVGGRLIKGAARQLIDRFMRSLVKQAGGGTESEPGPQRSGFLGWLRRIFGGRP